MHTMLKKPLKIKGTEQRTALVEYLVSKRVKFLEYLKELHGDTGALWMNTVHVDRGTLGAYYGVSEACLRKSTTTARTTSANNNSNTRATPAATAVVTGSSAPPPPRDEAAETTCVTHVRLPLELDPTPRDSTLNNNNNNTSAAAPPPSTSASSSAAMQTTSQGNPVHSTSPEDKGRAGQHAHVVSIALDRLPQAPHADAEWARRQLPCYVSLAFALSDMLLSPISGAEFAEAVYGLLLELGVEYASGPATKALAQRQLRQFRQGMSAALVQQLRGKVSSTATNASNDDRTPNNSNSHASNTPSSDAEGRTAGGGVDTLTATETQAAMSGAASEMAQVKYYFLTRSHLSYSSAGGAGYDAVLPALCAVLIFTYRRLCDYDLMRSERSVKQVLSVDKRIARLVLEPVCRGIERVAQHQCLTEMYVLSTQGLFAAAQLMGGTTTNLVEEVLHSQVTTLQKDNRDDEDEDEDELGDKAQLGGEDDDDEGDAVNAA